MSFGGYFSMSCNTPLVNNYQRVGSVSELERQIALKLVGHLGFDSDELIRWNPSAI